MIKLEDKTMTKKIYNQPEVTVASIALQSIVLAGSPAAGNQMVLIPDETDDQW